MPAGDCPTCKPTCDDICRGDCGCIDCQESEAYHDNEPQWPGLQWCEACGRLMTDHKPDCVLVGGERDLRPRAAERLKQLNQRYGVEDDAKRRLFE